MSWDISLRNKTKRQRQIFITKIQTLQKLDRSPMPKIEAVFYTLFGYSKSLSKTTASPWVSNSDC